MKEHNTDVKERLRTGRERTKVGHERAAESAARAQYPRGTLVARVGYADDLSPLQISVWLRLVPSFGAFFAARAKLYDHILMCRGVHDRSLIRIFEDAALSYSSEDAAKIPEQFRHFERCLNGVAAFNAIIDETGTALKGMCSPVYKLCTSKMPALAEALLENGLHGWNDWKQADRPIDWVRKAAENIHKGHEPISMDQQRRMLSLDVPSLTNDPYAALLRDPGGDWLDAEIHARVDLVTACEREGLARETSLLALAQYSGVPRTIAAEMLCLSKKELGAAAREMYTAKPALQDRLATYRLKRHR